MSIHLDIKDGSSHNSDHGGFEKFEVESALRTVKEFQRVVSNEKLMDEVEKIADQEAKTVKSIADIRAAYDELVEKENLDGVEGRFARKVEKAKADNQADIELIDETGSS